MPSPRKGSPKVNRAASTKAKTSADLDLFFSHLSGAHGVETASNVTRSCEASRVTRDYVYTKRKEDPEFAKRFEKAYQDGYDVLEEACQKRAYGGFIKTTRDGQGNVIKTEENFSDALAMFLLKGNKSDKFRDRVETIEGAGAAPSRLQRLTDEELDAELKRRLG